MEELKEENKRVQYIDIARGIAIILMVVGHVLDRGWKRNVIFSFHMPLFIIISGMFYKEKSLKETVKNIFFKLILPYLICTLILQIFTCTDIRLIGNCIVDWFKQIAFSYSYWGKIIFSNSAAPLDILWFFPFLALVKLIFVGIKKISKEDSIKLLCLCVLISYMGYILGIKKYYLPFSLDVAMFSIVFYYIGYIFSKSKLLEKIFSNYMALIVIFIIWIIGIKFSCIELAVRKYVDGAFSILIATCGSIIVLKLSQIIEKYSKHFGNFLSYFGRNSMYVLLLHQFETTLVDYNSIFVETNKSIFKLQVSALKVLLVSVGTFLINSLKIFLLHFKIKKD